MLVPANPGSRLMGTPCALRVGMSGRTSRSASPWKLGGVPFGEFVQRVWREVSEDDVSERAAALSYYFLFALFPALLFLTALLGFLPVSGLQERLMAYMREVLPTDAASTLERTVTEVLRGRRTGLVSLGLLVTLWASSNGMMSLMTTMNVVYDVTERRPWWTRRLLAIVLTLAFAVFIVAALVLLVFGPPIGAIVAGWFGLGALFTRIWNILNVPLAIACALLGIELVYYLAPAGERQWRWITPGATGALVAWLAMSFGLRVYVGHIANYSATYGSIGGVILLMFWLYLSSVVFLVGAEIDSEIEAATRKAQRARRVSLRAIA
jgi:membrane protein